MFPGAYFPGKAQLEILFPCQRLDEAKPPAFMPQSNNRQEEYLKFILLKKTLIGKGILNKVLFQRTNDL